MISLHIVSSVVCDRSQCAAGLAGSRQRGEMALPISQALMASTNAKDFWKSTGWRFRQVDKIELCYCPGCARLEGLS